MPGASCCFFDVSGMLSGLLRTAPGVSALNGARHELPKLSHTLGRRNQSRVRTDVAGGRRKADALGFGADVVGAAESRNWS